jgi:hypothetical protein
MLRGANPPARKRQSTLPECADQAITRALRPAPEDRFESAAEFGAALMKSESVSSSF